MTMKAKQNKNKSNSKIDSIDYNNEFLIVSHLIKYNLYLLSKSILFSSLLNNSKKDPLEIAKEVNKIIDEIDLSNKSKDS